MISKLKTPRIFISYSWSTPQHIAWVLLIAERLRNDGVDVAIDKWDLKPGHDMNKFMESMVNAPDIDKVLLVCDKLYTEKANGRKGGVGTEAQIISPEIYRDASQEKFIPIFCEINPEDGELYKPTYLGTRFGIDFSKIEIFEERYDELLRLIYDRPAHTRPALGSPPAYLFEEPKPRYQISLLLQRLDSTIENKPNRLNALLKEFLTEFLKIITETQVSLAGTSENMAIATLSYQAVLSYTPYRNEFVTLIDKISKSGVVYDIDLIIEFLEKILPLPDNRIETHHYEFINYELFVLLTAVLLKNENYEQLGILLHTTYYYKFDHNKQEKSFRQFKQQARAINYYMENINGDSQMVNGTAQAVATRVPAELTKQQIVNADLLLSYVNDLKEERQNWFPIMMFYTDNTHQDFYDRLKSIRFFKKVKALFNVSDPNELREKLKEMKQKKSADYGGIHYPNSFVYISPVFDAIDAATVATR